MGNAAFLLIAVVFSLVLSLILWLRSRKPTRFTSSIDDFQREMKALGGEPELGSSVHRRGSGRSKRSETERH